MAERRTSEEGTGRKPVYRRAEGVPGGGQVAEVSQALQQRTVVTSLTQGTVTLRYAPRTPKASGPVDTAS